MLLVRHMLRGWIRCRREAHAREKGHAKLARSSVERQPPTRAGRFRVCVVHRDHVNRFPPPSRHHHRECWSDCQRVSVIDRMHVKSFIYASLGVKCECHQRRGWCCCAQYLFWRRHRVWPEDGAWITDIPGPAPSASGSACPFAGGCGIIWRRCRILWATRISGRPNVE